MNAPTKKDTLDGTRMESEYQIYHEIVTNDDKTSQLYQKSLKSIRHF